MPTQLSLYNDALRSLGERKLASLSENREPRRVLDDVWDGAIKACLEEADWKFAQRTAKLIYEPSYTPPFGYQRQFSKPSDFARLSRMCVDERLNQPLLAYVEEAGFWFADLDELYVSYVSTDGSYGNDMSLWPESFTSVVGYYLAMLAVKRLEQSDTSEEKAEKRFRKALQEAKSKDALAGPTRMLPPGSWTRSRSSSAGLDNGNRHSLIG